MEQSIDKKSDYKNYKEWLDLVNNYLMKYEISIEDLAQYKKHEKMFTSNLGSDAYYKIITRIQTELDSYLSIIKDLLSSEMFTLKNATMYEVKHNAFFQTETGLKSIHDRLTKDLKIQLGFEIDEGESIKDDNQIPDISKSLPK